MARKTIVWLRRDLRVRDNSAMLAAASRGGVIPIFIRDASTNALGAAPAWRLGLGIAHLQSTLTEMGSQLVLRSGDALSVLRQLIRETQADAVFW